MRAVICGANGAMGRLLQTMLQEEIAGLVSLDGQNGVPKTFEELGLVNADVLVDFSHHSAAADVIDYAKAVGCPVVIGTTGHAAEEKQLILDAAKELPVFFSGNMSLGIAVLCKLAKQAAACRPFRLCIAGRGRASAPANFLSTNLPGIHKPLIPALCRGIIPHFPRIVHRKISRKGDKKSGPFWEISEKTVARGSRICYNKG